MDPRRRERAHRVVWEMTGSTSRRPSGYRVGLRATFRVDARFDTFRLADLRAGFLALDFFFAVRFLAMTPPKMDELTLNRFPRDRIERKCYFDRAKCALPRNERTQPAD